MVTYQAKLMTELFPLYCKEGSMVVVDTRVLGLVGGGGNNCNLVCGLQHSAHIPG